MQRLTYGDLILALINLLTDRLGTWQATGTYAFYGPMLQDNLTALQALPEALKSNRPLAALLTETDTDHDGFGGAIYFLCEALLRHPKASQELKAAAARVRTKFIPRLGLLKDSYADEAKVAAKNRPALAEYEADLKLIKTPDGETAYEWVVGFLDQGDKLNKLLSDRATIQAGAEAAAEIAVLRSSTIGLLGRARTALADEMNHKPTLPRNLDSLVFGYFDVLNEFREANSASAEPPPPPKVTVPAQPPPAAGTPSSGEGG